MSIFYNRALLTKSFVVGVCKMRIKFFFGLNFHEKANIQVDALSYSEDINKSFLGELETRIHRKRFYA